jgi:hypothetical protein
MLGTTLYHEPWFNTMVLSEPAKKKKKPDADKQSSKQSGGAH